ncbi:DUF6292 family protein [Allokutzneria sp. A3M-2-11 16]|uniref:DUF6292 family protein n=1 Tax=Allokutzneria sp. A3M-2-11 16 TaxID=2962043 RepID=UPI0020B8374F|nr:DUF6292 family protein [Allokutzneria sp. A3M-2-11 16]MCP3803776.1 DUF6292 family protein [Allokutzneria sp. A3M-2-11 16]
MEDVAAPGIPLDRGLAGYLNAVADAVGIPAEATSFEISDTATAYLGLPHRSRERPTRDLMLVWSEGHGWAVAVEPGPGEPSAVLAHLGSEHVAPAPAVVARFVADVVAGREAGSAEPVFPTTTGRARLAQRLARYARA